LFQGAFEFQGQKCSAASRAYIPKSIWPQVKEKLARLVEQIKVGDVAQFDTFSGAVIDEKSYRNIVGYIDHATQADDAQVVIGGEYDSSKGWFVWPTVIETSNPKYRSMQEEIFGPVLSVYVFADEAYSETLKIINETSPYALTGSVFARDRSVIYESTQALEYAAGNFYINDKPTGAVVGQQPFGGGRASGTNDKAGSLLNLLRWTSPRTIKENFHPPEKLEYAHLPDEQ
jgi:1-pyrroline-5-carboxylate dehydrogenase